MKKLLLLLILPFLFSGCDKNKADPVNEYSYYPLLLNAPLIYQVTRTSYAAGQPDSVVTNWQEKDEVIRVSETADGFPVYVVAHSTRKTPSEYWQKIKEYTVTRYPDKLLLSLDNITTVPMMFPVSLAVPWNTNQYNTLAEEIFRYENVGQQKKIGELDFSNTLQVSGRNFTDDPVVQYNLGYRQYALGVGLIFEEQTDYEYCQEEHCLGQRVISSGTSTIRQLIEYPGLNQNP